MPKKNEGNHTRNKATGRSSRIPIKGFASPEEIEAYRDIRKSLDETPIPPEEILANLSLYLDRSTLAHLLFMHRLYTEIINVHGIIVEFGVRWGRNLALLTTLRTIFEPYNITRKIVGFDTFAGFPSVSPEDGDKEGAVPGGYSVTAGYEDYLGNLLNAHERLGFRSHIRKYELIKGDVIETLPKYLEENPETIIALAYFDLDLYEPTKKSLELIQKHLTRGSVVGFDELTLHDYPGETLALQSVWGSLKVKIQRDPIAQYPSFVVIE